MYSISFWQNVFSEWQRFNLIVAALHRQHDLTGLVQWAKRKRLADVQHAYTNRLLDEESRLARYKVCSPRLFWWATLAVHVHRLIVPQPRYKPRGFAAKYHLQKLAF